MEYSSAFTPGNTLPDSGELPPVHLDHLHRLTDDTGLLQHANFAVPNFHEGYCIDDNARALILSIDLDALGHTEAFDLTCRYLAFISYAFNPETGRFRNFMNIQRQWLEASGSEDCHGRTLWALGHVLSRSRVPGLQDLAVGLFQQALPAFAQTRYARTWAFGLLGIDAYLGRFNDDATALQIREELTQRLYGMYQDQRSEDWCWYENHLTYSNAVLPQAMILCGRATRDSALMEAGLASLAWLIEVQCSEVHGHFVPIGSNGFYWRGRTRARYAQQPLEARGMVSACLAAYRATQDRDWYARARWAFAWFLGHNDLNLPLYDAFTGGCRDGLEADGINQNQGAESTLAFLQALVELRLLEKVV